MKQYMFLLPLTVLLLASCGAGGSGDSGRSASSGGALAGPAEEAEEIDLSSVREQAASGSPSELEEKFERLGFQTPTKDLQAIDFSLMDLAGQETALASFAGSVIFLNFWATWCGPCRAEIPSMEQLYGELKDRDFTILAVNSQEAADQVSSFVGEAGMSFPVLLDSTGRVGAAYGVRAIPTTYIIDPQGAIRARMVGTRQWYSPEIISLVEDLLR